MPNLGKFIDCTDRSFNIGQPNGLIETLAYFSVIHQHPYGRHTNATKFLKGFSHDYGHFSLIVKGELLFSDDVDVGLAEFPEATILGSLTPPHLLDLVTLKRKV